MGSVIMLSGPVGAGKTTVAEELAAGWPTPLARIEGDVFWTFLHKPGAGARREHFPVVVRAMTAAAVPFARSGLDVLLDFSIPPEFLPTAAKILKEVPLDYVVLLPKLEHCAARSAARPAGAIADYGPYQDFYAMFRGVGGYALDNGSLAPATAAARIRTGLAAGQYRVRDSGLG